MSFCPIYPKDLLSETWVGSFWLLHNFLVKRFWFSFNSFEFRVFLLLDRLPYPDYSLPFSLKETSWIHTFTKSIWNENSFVKDLISSDIRGSLNKFPDFFRMGTFIDSTHMKL